MTQFFALIVSATALLSFVAGVGVGSNHANKLLAEHKAEVALANKVTEAEYNGEIAKIRAMVEAKAVTWDVVDVDTQTALAGCAACTAIPVIISSATRSAARQAATVSRANASARSRRASSLTPIRRDFP